MVPTVKDLFANAKYPKDLNVCIGWQHAGDEDISALKKIKGVKAEQIKILDIPHTETKGACWVRSKIQNEYAGEEYTLQLDSHHRFVKHWDVKLVETLVGLQEREKSAKPLITAYLPSYFPKKDPDGRLQECWQINFDRFLPEGVIFLRPSLIKDWAAYNGKPVLGKTLSAHFIFTLGQWCKEVPYDPELYFHGEESTLAVRSWTHGYDIWHPTEVVCWHHYTRDGAKKHWDDHTNWNELNLSSYNRAKTLLGVDGADPKSIKFGIYGLGKKRKLRKYEIFAGVDFATRRFDVGTISEKLPPNNKNEKELTENLRSWHKHCLDVYKPDLPETDYDFWCCVFKDDDNNDIYRRDLDANEIQHVMSAIPDDKFIHIWRDFYSDKQPTKWVVWPHSKAKGWETKIIEGRINYK